MFRGLGIAHAMWRLFPPRLRRQMYERSTTALASKARTTSDMPDDWDPPFLVAGPLSAPTGLGESARLLLRGLIDLGHPVSYVDLAGPMMQPSTVGLPKLPPPRPGPGTLILAVQPPSVGHALLLLGRRLLKDKRRVGFWMWELEKLPVSWRGSVRLVHDLAAPSRFVKDVLERELEIPVTFLGYPFRPLSSERPAEPLNAAITFGAGFDLGSTVARKNPFAIVDAFQSAFVADERVLLSVKVRGEDADSGAYERLTRLASNASSRIRLVRGDLDEARLAAWFDTLDVLVSLHRSEGFGLFPAEAMLRGKPVIATDWSATAEFVTPSSGWPVPARLIPVEDATGRYELQEALWADPDPTQAASAMRQAYALGREGLHRKGQAACALMAETYSLAAFQTRLRRSFATSSPRAFGPGSLEADRHPGGSPVEPLSRSDLSMPSQGA